MTVLSEGTATTQSVLYGAKSSVDGNESRESQLATLRAAVAAEGWIVAHTDPAIFFDEDSSGFHGSRGTDLVAAQRLAESLAADGTDVRLCAVVSDRFARGDARHAKHLAERLSEARRGGYHLWTAHERDQVDNFSFAGMLGDRAHEDSRAKAAHVRRGLDDRFYGRARHTGSAKPLGKPTRGQRVVKQIAEDGKTVLSRREIDPDAQPYIEAGARAWVMEDRSFLAIARGWNRDGFHKLNGKPWQPGDVSELFARPGMGGYAVHAGEWVYMPDAVPAVLPADLFLRLREKIAAIAALPGKGRGRRPSALHLFQARSSVPLNSPCGGRYVISRDTYRCNNVIHGQGCGCPTMKRRMIDEPFFEALLQGHLDAAATRAALLAASLTETAAISAQIEQAVKLIRQSSMALDRAATDYRSGELSAKNYEQLAERLDRDEREGNERLARLRRDAEEIGDQQTSINEVGAAMRAHLAAIRAAVDGTGGEVSLTAIGSVRAALRALFTHADTSIHENSLLISPRLRPEFIEGGRAISHCPALYRALYQGEPLDEVIVSQTSVFREVEFEFDFPSVPLAIPASAR